MAVVAYNVLAVVKAALRAVHGEKKIDSEVSGYYLAHEIAGTYRGMLIAIPPQEWSVFRRIPLEELVAVLQFLAQWVKLAAFRKHPRGPKKPSPKRHYDRYHPRTVTPGWH